MGKYENLAKEIVRNVGGKENVSSLDTLYYKASLQTEGGKPGKG